MIYQVGRYESIFSNHFASSFLIVSNIFWTFDMFGKICICGLASFRKTPRRWWMQRWLKSEKLRTMATNTSDMAKRHFEGILEGRRSSLAESITLVESTHPGKRKMGQEILSRVQQCAKERREIEGTSALSFRIGLSGPPGAGKSTFIEALGTHLTSQGQKLAVLAVDPSSSTRGGSLLGDKTRMTILSRQPNAYIRPSPTLGTLGGVTRNTNEAIVLCEGAGYNIIIVETVGVGQSEHTVVDMVDMFVLLIPPAGGDELQGLKRGIVEFSDLVVVNKADGDLLPAARRVRSEYVSALKFVRPRSKSWKPMVKQVSSITNEGIVELWETMTEFRQKMLENGVLEERRQQQLRTWLWNYVSDNLLMRFKTHPKIQKSYENYCQLVREGKMIPGQAADKLLEEFVRLGD